MKRRRVAIVAAAATIAAILVSLAWPRSTEKEVPEPEYKGKKLSQWITIYSDSRSTNSRSGQPDEAAAAVRSIGTNAIPHLMSWLDHSPAMQTVVVDVVLGELRKVFRNGTPTESHIDRAQRLAILGVDGFRILGTNAAMAVPELGKRLLTNSPGVDGVAMAISYLGKEALAPLCSAMSNGPASNRRVVASRIGSVRLAGTNAAGAVPVLARFTGDKDEGVAKASVVSLGKLRLEPEIALSALSSALRDPRPEVRGAAADAIGNFKGTARPVLATLLAAANDPDKDVRKDVTNALSKIAPELGYKPTFKGADGPPAARDSGSEGAGELTNGVSGVHGDRK